MRLLLITLIASSLLILQGCAAPGSRTDNLSIKHSNRGDVNVALIPAEYREVYFSSGNSDERHCRAPDPDFTVLEGISLNLGAHTGAGTSENAGIGDSQSAMGLGGRSSTVLIARELMYRACELTANINADNETTLDTYTKFLGVIERLTDAHLSEGTNSSGNTAEIPDTNNISDTDTDSSDDD